MLAANELKSPGALKWYSNGGCSNFPRWLRSSRHRYSLSPPAAASLAVVDSAALLGAQRV